MFIDSSTFPIVWMRQNTAPDENPQAAFDEFANLLARRQAFVFLNDAEFNEASHEHSQKERKQTVLWMKKNKIEIRTFVKGMIQIEPNAGKRLALKAFAIMFGKFWGYPMMITASQDEALAMAHQLLRNQPDRLNA